jgi:hypothetical protein
VVRKTAILLVFVAAATAAVGWSMAGTWFGNNRPDTSTDSATKIHIAPVSLNFGEAWVTDDFEWPVTMENVSDETLKVTGIAGSCTCQRFEPSSFELAPGATQTVKIRIDLRSQLSQSNSSVSRTRFWATVAGQPKPQYWELTGNIKTALQAPPRSSI